uniref:Hpt domain-containing protein n=1 Tax=Ningiella ruwaisensis TaxID=2364274 RepID=UPI0010A0967D|nr:Hpt domain-containing protein [Ningiella ruwaisensis]
MHDRRPLLDLGFGLSQLGGNEKLLMRMLGKFRDEFEHMPSEVKSALDKGDLEDAKIKVHTTKGITGNLGLMALFDVSKELDRQIKAEDIEDETLNAFELTMSQTCEAIDKQDDKEVDTQLHARTHIADAKTQLLDKLARHEFIDDTLLHNLVSSLDISKEQQASLINLVEELQYDEASELVKSLQL